MKPTLESLPFSARSDPEIAIEYLREDGMLLCEFPALQENKDVVLVAFIQNSKSLIHTTSVILSNPDFMRELIDINLEAIPYYKYKMNTEFIKEMLRKYSCLKFLHLILHKESILIALKFDPSQIKYVREEHLKDPEMRSNSVLKFHQQYAILKMKLLKT